MTDTPGSKLEKLLAFRLAHFEHGTEYDEAALRRHLGLEPVAHPEFLPLSPERKRLVRMDDREAKRELEEAMEQEQARMAAERESALLATVKDERIQSLEAQIAELRARLQGSAVAVAERPSSPAQEPQETVVGPRQPRAAVLAPGEDIRSLTFGEIKLRLAEEGLPPLPKNGWGVTKTEALEHYLSHRRARESKP